MYYKCMIAVDVLPQSFVTKALTFFIKFIVPRFVRFCQTRFRTFKVWLISILSTVENIDILYGSPSSASQGQWHGWVSVPNPAVTLYFLFYQQSTLSLPFSLSLNYFPVSSPSFSFILPASVSPSVSRILTFLHSLSCLPLSSITWIIFLEIQKEKTPVGDQGVPCHHWKLRIQCWPQFSAHFLHFLSIFFFFWLRRTSKSRGRGRGLVAWWTS